MSSALSIDISATRAITATGRLVAGETAAVSVIGATPKKMYLVNAARDVIAYCDDFEAGQDGGNGTINLATEQIAAIVAGIPAGRAFSVSCIVEGDDDAIVGYGFVPMVSAPMPSDLENVEVDLYLRASTIRALFADIPETYSNQRSLSAALSQVVNILKTIGLAACVAFTALATEWQDVPADTIIGDGLTLANGTISAAGGGGIGTNDVRAIIEADAGPTNRLLHADSSGALKMTDGDSAFPVVLSGSADGGGTGGLKWDAPSFEGYFAPEAGYVWAWVMKNRKFVLPIMKGGTAANPAEIATTAEVESVTNGLGTAAYRDASEFATAADEALVYQLITNRLSGVTFDFATVAGLYLAISNIVAAQGGAITNFPAIP